MKKLDLTALLDMLNKDILVPGKYVITKNYLTVPAEFYDKVSAYLSDNDYGSGGVGHCYNGGEAQQWTFYINQKD